MPLAHLSRQHTSLLMLVLELARFGGGLSLQSNAKLYILKYEPTSIDYESNINMVAFIANSAEYGGAIYVDDDTISGVYTSDPKTEYFLQELALYDIYLVVPVQTQSIYFSENCALLSTSGSTLYGGMLDRCAVSLEEVQYIIHVNAMLKSANMCNNVIATLDYLSKKSNSRAWISCQ